MRGKNCTKAARRRRKKGGRRRRAPPVHIVNIHTFSSCLFIPFLTACRAVHIINIATSFFQHHLYLFHGFPSRPPSPSTRWRAGACVSRKAFYGLLLGQKKKDCACSPSRISVDVPRASPIRDYLLELSRFINAFWRVVFCWRSVY